jgi:hypothetical protein
MYIDLIYFGRFEVNCWSVSRFFFETSNETLWIIYAIQLWSVNIYGFRFCKLRTLRFQSVLKSRTHKAWPDSCPRKMCPLEMSPWTRAPGEMCPRYMCPRGNGPPMHVPPETWAPAPCVFAARRPTSIKIFFLIGIFFFLSVSYSTKSVSHVESVLSPKIRKWYYDAEPSNECYRIVCAYCGKPILNNNMCTHLCRLWYVSDSIICTVMLVQSVLSPNYITLTLSGIFKKMFNFWFLS